MNKMAAKVRKQNVCVFERRRDVGGKTLALWSIASHVKCWNNGTRAVGDDQHIRAHTHVQKSLKLSLGEIRNKNSSGTLLVDAKQLREKSVRIEKLCRQIWMKRLCISGRKCGRRKNIFELRVKKFSCDGARWVDWKIVGKQKKEIAMRAMIRKDAQ